MPKTEWRIIPGTDGKERIRAKYELKRFANQPPYFSLTADIERLEGRRWADSGGGCAHELILKAFPEMKTLALLHRAKYPNGTPMHYQANALYWRKEYVRMFFDTHNIEAMVKEAFPDPDANKIEQWKANYMKRMEHRLPIFGGQRKEKEAFDKEVMAPIKRKREYLRSKLTREYKDHAQAMRNFAATVMLGILDTETDTADTLTEHSRKELHTLLTQPEEDVKAWLAARAQKFPAIAKATATQFKLDVSEDNANTTGKDTIEEIMEDFASTGLGQLCAEVGLTMTVEHAPRNPNIQDASPGSRHYDCVLELEGRKMTVPFTMGPGVTAAKFVPTTFNRQDVIRANTGVWQEYPRPPHLGDVLECLILDQSGLEQGFEGWANDLGYGSDSREAEKIYNACVRQREELKKLLGAHYDRFFGQDSPKTESHSASE